MIIRFRRSFSGRVGHRFNSKLSFNLHLVVFLAAMGGACSQASAQNVLTNILQIRALSPAEAQTYRSVKLKATISYRDPRAGITFIFDQSGGIFINPKEDAKLEAGDQVEISGVAEQGSRLPFVSRATVRVIGKAPLPPAKKIDAKLLTSGVADSEWVQIEGIVRNDERVIQVRADGQQIKLWLLKEQLNTLPKLPIGSLIKVEGVGGLDLKEDGSHMGALFVPGKEHIEILRFGPSNTELLDVVSVDQLKQSPALEGSLVRLEGSVMGLTADGLLVVNDSTGTFRIDSDSSLPVKANDWVEVVGFANLKSEIPLIENVRMRARGPRLGANPTDKPSTFLPVLFDTRAVQELSKSDTTNGWPVRLSAIVTYYDPATNIIAVQDAVSGIFVFPGKPVKGLKVGDKVEVNGFSALGQNAHKVEPAFVNIIGESQLPIPEKVGLDAISSRKVDGEYVEVTGVVRKVTESSTITKLELGVDDGLLEAYLPGPLGGDELIDTEVSIKGVCTFRPATQLREMEHQLWMNARNGLVILSRPARSVQELAITPASELWEKPRVGSIPHRIHMQGQVTAIGRNLTYLQDSTGAFVVKTDPSLNLAEGEVLDLFGFAVGGKLPSLQHVTLRPGIPAAPVQPLASNPGRALGAAHAGVLLRLNGNLLQVQKRESDLVLVLRDGFLVFEAFLDLSKAKDLLEKLKPDSELQLTGVSVTEYDAIGTPTSFRMMLRSPQDLIILEAPSWWTPRRLIVFLALLLLCVLAAILWAATLRRKLESQTQLIKTRLEREIILETKLTRMVDSSLIGIVFWDDRMRVIDANQAFLNMLGYKLEDLCSESRKWTSLVEAPGSERLELELETLRKTGRCQPLELEMKANGGAILPVLIGAAMLSSNPLTGVAYLLDRRGQRELEHQLRQAQKMESIGRLAGGVAHDFNNLLTVIKGHCAMLISSENLSAEENDSVREIIKSTERAGHLTRQLLTFSRKQVFQLRAIDLNEVIRNLTRMLSRIMGEDVSLQCWYEEDLPGVMADSGMIEQVVMNLAVNARDAMKDGGALEIRTGLVDGATVRGKPANIPLVAKYVSFSISDTGAGMNEEVLQHLFEPFFTTKEVGKGTGLGLATVYGIIQSHHGWLDVETAIGKGTTFKVYLPALGYEVMPTPPLPAGEKSKGGSETILVVEDEPSLQHLIRSSLSRQGYTIHVASSGKEALQMWDQQTGNIDLLLTDMVMPHGMSGKQLAESLLEKNSALKIIFSSGYSVDFSNDNSFVEGYNFVAKPYDPEDLARVIRRRLDEE